MKIYKRPLFIFIVITLTNLSECEYANFSGQDITSIFFGTENQNIFPAAYGDFNADKLTDIFAVSHDHSKLLIYFTHQDHPMIHTKLPDISCSIPSETGTIVGISPGDFTGDGLLDVMVTFQVKKNDSVSIHVVVFFGNLTSLDCSSGNNEIVMVQEPLMFDVNGDQIMDLFGEIYYKYNNKTMKKKILRIFKAGGGFNDIQFVVTNSDDSDYENHDLSVPHSNSFVDTNGDLVPELVFVVNITTPTKNKTVWISSYVLQRFRVEINALGDPTPTFEFLGETPVDDESHRTPVIGQPIFFDMNQNGQLMHIIPFSNKDGKNSGLKVIEENEMKILPIIFADTDGAKWDFIVPTTSDTAHPNLHHFYTSTIVLRVGDFNLDGYPDLIGVLIKQKTSSSVNSQKSSNPKDLRMTRAVLFENIPCEHYSPLLEDECPYQRTFKLNFEAMAQYENVILATFFDIHEDGLVDILLVNRTGLKNDTYGIFAFQNSPDYDANFIKVMVLSSLPSKSIVPYGNIISGPVIEYMTTTQVGTHQKSIAAQLYRSSYMALDIPYTIFGIGQTPNFIEILKISVSPSIASNHSHEWFQIIPNSQIFIIPTIVYKPWTWTAKLFLTPSKAVLNTFGVLLLFCAFIAMIVAGLEYKERREDRKERLEEVNRFHMM